MATGTTQTITNGLIFYVDAANGKSYPGSGTNTTNLGRITSTGSLVNGVSYNSSYGGSFVFDGTNDYISCGDTNFQITGNSLSFECCFYHDGTDKNNMPIFAKRNPNSPFNQFSIGVNNGNFYAGGIGKVVNMFLRPDESTNQGPPDPKDRGCAYTLPSAGIYHLVGVNDSTSARLFVNGVLVATTTSSQTPNNFTISSHDMRIGNSNYSAYYTGSIQFIKLYNRALSSDEVLQNYESTRERFNLRGIAIDPDASLFLRTVGITDTTQQSAIDTLVLELKNAGLWSKMRAIYPFVGGTAATHKWNLKDPRDVDAAYRLTFFGGWTHSSTGADPNGTTGYALTYFNASTLSSTSTHVSFYSREDSNGLFWDIGANNNDSSQLLSLYARESGTAKSDSGDYRISRISVNTANSIGYYVSSRTANNVFKLFKNNSQIGSSTATDNSGMPNFNVSISAVEVGVSRTWQQYSNRQTAFATIGDGLTDAEASSLYTIVQKYQTTLGRQV
jgi:hypothetical protein